MVLLLMLDAMIGDSRHHGEYLLATLSAIIGLKAHNAIRRLHVDGDAMKLIRHCIEYAYHKYNKKIFYSTTFVRNYMQIQIHHVMQCRLMCRMLSNVR